MSQLETLTPEFLTRLSGFGETPGPFGPIAAPFTQQNAERELFDSLIQQLLDHEQPDFRPAPDLPLPAKPSTGLGRDPVIEEVLRRRRVLGEPLPGPNSPPEVLAAFEREVENRRRALAESRVRDPIVRELKAIRSREIAERTAGMQVPGGAQARQRFVEETAFERFLESAPLDQFLKFAQGLVGEVGGELERQQAGRMLERLESRSEVGFEAEQAARNAARIVTNVIPGIDSERELATAARGLGQEPPLPLRGAIERSFGEFGQSGDVGALRRTVGVGLKGAELVTELIGFGKTLAFLGQTRGGQMADALATEIAPKAGIAQGAAREALRFGLFQALNEPSQVATEISRGVPTETAVGAGVERFGLGLGIGGAVGAGAAAFGRRLPRAQVPQEPATPLPRPLRAEVGPEGQVTPLRPVERPQVPLRTPEAAPAEPALSTRQQEVLARQEALRQEFAAVPRETAAVTPPTEGVPTRAQPHPERAGQEAIQAQTQAPARTQAVQTIQPSRPGEVGVRIEGLSAKEADDLVNFIGRHENAELVPAQNFVRGRAKELGLTINQSQARQAILEGQRRFPKVGMPARIDELVEGLGRIQTVSPKTRDLVRQQAERLGIVDLRSTLQLDEVIRATQQRFPSPIRQPSKPFAGVKAEPEPTAPVIEPIPGIVRPPGPKVQKPTPEARAEFVAERLAEKPKVEPPTQQAASEREAQELMERFLGDITIGGFTPARVKAAAAATIRFTRKLVEQIPKAVTEKAGQSVVRRAGRAIVDTPPLRFAAEAKDTLVGSVTARLRKIGPEGREVERRLFEANDRAEDIAGRIGERFRAARESAIEGEARKALQRRKGGTGTEADAAEAFENHLALTRARIKIDTEYVALQKWKTYGGKKPEISEGAARLETEFGAAYEATGDLFDKLGGQVWEPTTGAYRRMHRIGRTGFPRMLKDDVIDALHKQSGKTYEALKAESRKSGIDLRALKEAPNGFSPTLEKARGPALPAWAYDWEPELVWPKWSRSTSKRLADIEWLGQKRYNIDAAIKSVPREHQEFVRQAFKRHFPERDTLLQRGLQQLVSFTVLEKLGLNYFVAVKNIAGGQANIIATTGWKQWVTSINAAIRDPALRKEIRASGALRQARVDVFNRAAADESFLAKAARKGLTASGFLPGEVGNRISAAANFVRWAEWAGSQLKSATGRELADLERGLIRLRLDPTQLRKQGGKLTPLQRRRAMRVGANNTQFTSEFLFLPLWASSPVMRPATLFKKFAFGQARFWNNLVLPELTRGNLVPVLSILGIGTAVGELVNNTKAQLSGSEREGKSFTEAFKDRDFAAMWNRFANDLLTTGTFGLYGDVIEQVGASVQGRRRRSIVTPAILATPTNLSELVLRKIQQGELRGRDYWRALTREIPAIRTGYDAWNELTGLNDEQRLYNNIRRQVFFFEKEKGFRSPRGTPSFATPYYADVREAMVDETAKLAGALDDYLTFARGRGDSFSDARRRLGGHLRALRPLDLNATRKREFLAGVTAAERKQFTALSTRYDQQMRRVLNELIRESWRRTAPVVLRKAG